MYLNRGVYANRVNPTFSEADMDKVINYADLVSGKSLNFYWNNYQPNNDVISSELLFTVQGQGGLQGNGETWIWFGTMPSGTTVPGGGGWSGWATTPECFDNLTDGDIRKSYDDPEVIEHGGYNVGFLIGQINGPGGTDPIPGCIVTKEINSLIGEGSYSGARVLKYVPDFQYPYSPDNDWILMSYSDVLLMKAEALLRKGDAITALTIVNDLRANRSVTPGSLPSFTTLTLEDILAERGREFYWQGTRRTDLIRYGKFLDARTLKPVSDPIRLVFPIPQEAVYANPGLTQNQGY